MKHIVIDTSISYIINSCRSAEKNPSSANFDDEYGAT